MGLKPRDSGPKTRPTPVDAVTFIAGLVDERRRRECETLLALMRRISGAPPVMWGSSIVGFGTYHYKYASGREGDWMRVGFAPRKSSLTVYCMPGFSRQADLLAKLGPHKTSVSCLYIRRLDEVDLDVLEAIVKRSLAQMAEMYPTAGA